MIEIRSILCPVDFSEYSRRALDQAIAIGRRYDSTITALHVFPALPLAASAAGLGMPPFGPIDLPADDRERLMAELRQFVEAESSPGVRINTELREGHPVREILDEAASINADLLTVGAHGRSAVERMLLGSVAERLLHTSPYPVLTVPQAHPDAVPASPVVFKTILCAVDFSDCSMSALNFALSLAQEADAQLTILHVVSDEFLRLADPVTDQGMQSLSVSDYFRRRAEDGQRRLADAVPATVAAFCQVATKVTRGKPGTEILRLAREIESDLIVMGVQGRGAVDVAMFGSATQQVTRAAACPVLTLRQQTARSGRRVEAGGPPLREQ